MTTLTRIRRTALHAALGLALLGGTAAWAQQQADQNHDEHHPPGEQAQPATPAPAPAQRQATPQPAMPGGGMRPGGQQGMMMPQADMQRMMQMMQGMPGMMMGGMGMGMGMGGSGAMRPFERVEGQLAFFRTELRITEAQAAQWNAFAEVIRSQAARLRQAMVQGMAPGGQPATAPQLLERRAAALTAQLEATRAVSAAIGPLYASLSDEQKRTADELMAEHLRSMRMRGM